MMRLKKEMEMLQDEPPPGISCVPHDDQLDQLDAHIRGADGTPYARGFWKLDVAVPPRYPFEPPKVQFVTPIYHPNIDSAGRICLDVLNMPPKGAWKPALNLSTVLSSIQLLMSHPNPDDGLMADITQQYINDLPAFNKTAAERTRLHATPSYDPKVAGSAPADGEVIVAGEEEPGDSKRQRVE